MPPVEGLIKQSGLVIFAGFKVDGVTSLQTIQEWEVYEDPSFEKFEDEYFNYKPAWPDFDKNIPIVVSNHRKYSFPKKASGNNYLGPRLLLVEYWIVQYQPEDFSTK